MTMRCFYVYNTSTLHQCIILSLFATKEERVESLHLVCLLGWVYDDYVQKTEVGKHLKFLLQAL